MAEENDTNLEGPQVNQENLGRVESVEITEEMQTSYLNYAMSVIVSRALPDVRDGLKPVHRRILYAMHELGLTNSAKYRKSATVVGEVLGKYHPHGDIPVYDALVRLAQDFAMRYTLVDGQGNFGSVDGDSPAAMRYTEARMARISDELLADIEKDTIDFTDNFDATRKEPIVMPSKLPNLLLNGGSGIAVGMATNIPPHNLNEVVDATTHLIENPQANVEDLMKFIKGPDFPTGGTIYDQKEITAAYATGRGRVVMRATADIEEDKNGKFSIVVTELPYQVNKATLIARIAEMVKDKKLDGISDLRDESDRTGMRMVVELKRDARPQHLLNQLYKHTAMQLAFNVNMVALVDGTPQTLTLKTILSEYIKHRQQVVTRRTQFELNAAKSRAHILEGLKIALDHLDEVIATIRASKTQEEAKTNLVTKFKLSEIQAGAILDMQLRRLAALERQKIEDELKATLILISELEAILADPKKILSIITNELSEIKTKYGDLRKTKVVRAGVGEFSEEDLIPQEGVIVTLTEGGYVKRLDTDTFRTQHRGGKGLGGIMNLKDEDSIAHLFSANTHDNILFFTNKGRVFQTKVWELPEGSRQTKGQAVINLINLEANEKVTSVLNYTKETPKTSFLFMATKKGIVKKTSLEEFTNIRKNGMIAMRLSGNDELTWVRMTNGDNDIIMVTKRGMSIKFSEKDTRPLGRPTAGMMGIRMGKEDELVMMDIADPNSEMVSVTEHGYGKKTRINDWPKQGRAGIGVKAAEVTNRNGQVIAARVVNQEIDSVIITTKKGQVIKLPIKSVPRLQRQTQGVILIRLADKSDQVSALAVVGKDESIEPKSKDKPVKQKIDKKVKSKTIKQPAKKSK